MEYVYQVVFTCTLAGSKTKDLVSTHKTMYGAIQALEKHKKSKTEDYKHMGGLELEGLTYYPSLDWEIEKIKLEN